MTSVSDTQSTASADGGHAGRKNRSERGSPVIEPSLWRFSWRGGASSVRRDRAGRAGAFLVRGLADEDAHARSRVHVGSAVALEGDLQLLEQFSSHRPLLER